MLFVTSPEADNKQEKLVEASSKARPCETSSHTDLVFACGGFWGSGEVPI
jgi:hypothetical protein